MNTTFYIVLGLAAIAVLSYIVWPESGPRPVMKAPPTVKTDVEWINEAKCPDCHNQSLLSGPSGGMSMNVGCNSCLMEFNVHQGFGTGAFAVDRTGKMSVGRAQVFGIEPEEYASIQAAPVNHQGKPAVYALDNQHGSVAMHSSDD